MMLKRSSAGVELGIRSMVSNSESNIPARRTFVSVSLILSTGTLKCRATTGRICMIPIAPWLDLRSSMKRDSL